MRYLKHSYSLIYIFSFILLNNYIFAQGNNCSNPILISTLPFSYSGTTCGFGDDYFGNNIDVDLCSNVTQSGYFNDEDIIFTFTPTISGVYDIFFNPQNTSAAFHVLDSCPNDNNGNCIYYSRTTASCKNFLLKKDQTYFIVFDSRNITANCYDFNFTLNFESNPQILNDFCQNALPIQGNASNYNATDCQEPDTWTPNAQGDFCSGGLWNANQNGVWFTFENESAQNVDIEIEDIECNGSSAQNTLQLGVWSNTGTCDLNQESFFGCLVTTGDATLSLANLPQGSYYLFCDGTGSADCTWRFESDDIVILDTCAYNTGIMDNVELVKCKEECITANYDNNNEDIGADGDVVFILHEGNGASIVNEIARNTTPEFCYDSNIMSLNTTYYISALIGKDSAGIISELDSCTVLSVGQPVKWTESESILFSTPTAITCNQPNATLSIANAMPGSIYSWDTNDGSIQGSTNQSQINVNSGGTYEVTVTNEFGCSTTATRVLTDQLDAFEATISFTMDSVINCIIQSIDMNAVVIGTNNNPSYQWSYSGSNISTGSTISITDGGLYYLTITDNTTGCAKIDTINVIKDIYPPLFLYDVDELNCENDSVLLSGGSPLGGVMFNWSSLVNNDTIQLNNNENYYTTLPGTYLFEGLNPANGCESSIEIEVTQNTLTPIINAGIDTAFSCTNSLIELTGSATQTGTDFKTSWSIIENDISEFITNNTSLEISTGGIYVYELINLENNCTDSDTVIVSDASFLSVDYSSNPIICNSIFKSIDLNVSGGNEPYSILLNNEIYNSLELDSLTTGTYTIEIESLDGCNWDSTLTIRQHLVPTLDLGEDQFVDERDPVDIIADTNLQPNAIESITWQPSSIFSCTEFCLSHVINLTETVAIIATMVDTNGCTLIDTVIINVRKINYDVYAPNAFSPNGDGINDKFTIFGSPDLENIQELNIYSRWGELVYQGQNLTPNNDAEGWDGKFKGDNLNNGVYVYYAKLVFNNGRTSTIVGDISLLRF